MTKRIIYLFPLLFAISCASRIPAPEPIAVEGMRNPVQVGNMLIGGQPSEAALAELAERGYKTVLTVRGDAEVDWDEQAVVESLGMAFVSIPMENPVEDITDEQVSRFSEFMNQADGPMVLHCGSGNRISGLWALWLIEDQKMDPEKAISLAEQTGMTGVRPVVEKRLAGDR